MQHISYTDFKENMDTYMDQIAEGDMVTVRREDNANVVLLPETKYDALMEIVEDVLLLSKAERRKNSGTTDFSDFVREQRYSMDEIEKLTESVEIE